MPLYEVVLKQIYDGQEMINRWNYTRTGTPASVSGSFGLLYAMGFIPDGTPPAFPADTVFNLVRMIQTNEVHYVEAICKEIWDVEDFYTTPFVSTINGLQTGGTAPTFAAIGFRTNRVRQDIDRGTKRFSGFPQGWLGANNTVPGSAEAAENLAEEMSAALTYDDEGNTLTYSPCVVSKEKYHPATNPTGWAYRYYDTEAEQSTHLAQGILWQAYDTTRSQVSRQIGRGS